MRVQVIAGLLTIAFHLYCHRRYPYQSIVYSSSSLIGGTASTTKLALAPTAEDRDEDAGPEYGGTAGWHAQAFDHPALWKSQPVIWLARDQYGVSDAEVSRINGEDVESTNRYAELDKEGKLHVERPAPDEERNIMV
jgi:hypothetical protein